MIMMNTQTKTWIVAVALVLGTSVVTASVVSQRGPQMPEPEPQYAPLAVAAPSAYVDLTNAAETAVNSVVYISVTIEGKTQRM